MVEALPLWYTQHASLVGKVRTLVDAPLNKAAHSYLPLLYPGKILPAFLSMFNHLALASVLDRFGLAPHWRSLSFEM